jgi:hypothetical protein
MFLEELLGGMIGLCSEVRMTKLAPSFPSLAVRSQCHLVHGPTSYTAPKHVFLKYLYLNNYNRYLDKN